MNEYSEKWDEICFLLSDNIKQSLSERDFENQVVRAIEVLGWREFKNEIERQPTVQLGREGTLRPDLIIYGGRICGTSINKSTRKKSREKVDFF